MKKYEINDTVWVEAKLWNNHDNMVPTGKTIYVGPARILAESLRHGDMRIEVKMPFRVGYVNRDDRKDSAEIIWVSPKQISHIMS